MSGKIVSFVLLTLLLSSFVCGQVADEPVLEPDTKNAIKIDEFGFLNECDAGARVDILLSRLQNEPSATGYIIIYQGKDVLPADYESSRRERFIKNQLLFRNYDAGRIVFIRGGFREELSTEMWIVPSDADAPTPTNTVPAPVTPKNKTFLYDKNFLQTEEYYFYLDELILPSVKAQIEEKNRLVEEQLEVEKSNSGQSAFTEEETAEENFELPKPTPEEIEEAKFVWVNEKFGALIKNQKDSHGVLIFYADDAYYDVGKLQSLFEEGAQKIAEANKISVSKVQVVYGGYRGMVEVEFWMVPKKGKNPLPIVEGRPVEKTKN